MYRMRGYQGIILSFRRQSKEKERQLEFRQRRTGKSRDKVVKGRESFLKWEPRLVTVKKAVDKSNK